MGQNIVFLSETDQLDMNLTFIEQLPWHSFGHNNVGYIYAISQGAEVIFDFDDDNMLKFWLNSASPDPVLELDNFSPQGKRGKIKVSNIHSRKPGNSQ